MKTAVVTGASGFIGHALAEYLLEKGYQVYAVSRKKEPLNSEDRGTELTYVEADFSMYTRLGQLIPKADIFYHFAWDGVYGEKAGDYSTQLKNIQAACDALIAASSIGCKKFVLAGTVAELEIIEYLDQKERVPRQNCIYASAKLTAEVMCKILAKQAGIAFNAGLLANTIGPGDRSKRSTNSILSKFLKGEAPNLVKGEGLNDWLYIKDAVRLIEAMGAHGQNMKTYYIGHTDLWPLKKIIQRAQAVAAPNLELTFGTMPDQFLTDYSYISTRELYEDTGCRAEYSFEGAIAETVEWLRQMQTEKGI